MKSALFIFPHYDDEIFALSRLHFELQRGNQPICVFLIDGGHIREIESTKCLFLSGIRNQSQIIFIGKELRVIDGHLPERLSETFRILIPILSHRISRIYCPAWEGGHQDHDASHLLGVALARHFSLLNECFQYFTYNGYRTYGKFFRVAYPMTASGTLSRKISRLDGIKIACRVRFYPSQWKTWLGLFPPLLLHYLIKPEESLRAVSFPALTQRPHPGKLLYERYRRCSFEQFCSFTNDFLNDHVLESRREFQSP
ncbi:MAG TPA: hypothetical protein VKV95_06760 [Terriglobia bacterium]|nr:hypothetical protein [Terriglobia bacterium]